MRIALYEPDDPAPDPYPFGESRLAALTRTALEACGHEVELFPAGGPIPARPPAAAEAGAVDRLVERTVAGLRSGPGQPPQIWISARVSARARDPIGPAVSAALDIPYILLQPCVRSERQPNDPEGDMYMQQLIARAAGAISLSSASAEAVRGTGPEASGHCFALPPFVDLAWVNAAQRNRPQFRRLLAVKLQLRAEVPWLIAAGAMSTDGDLASWRIVQQAMSGLVAMDWHLIVVGAGSRQAEIAAMFCMLPGRRDRHVTISTEGELIDLLAAGDLFLWPSVDEGLSLTAVEAQAAGLGVVAGKSDAMADVVANGRTGMLVKPGNAASFANAVSFLLRHPEFRRTYAQEAPRWAVMNFDLTIVATQLDAALHRIERTGGGSDPGPRLTPVG